MSIQTKTMTVKSDTSLAETTTTIRDTVTFDVSNMPNGITYKGLKAVLSFADPIQWNKASMYDALTVVWDDASHGSYASKRPVPQNIELDNEFYWLRTADLDAQVEIYRQEVREMGGRVAANTQAIAGLNTNLDTLKSLQADNVNDMITKDLQVGSTVHTLGFYEKGDKGDALYVIKDSGIEDGATIFKLANNNKAVLIGTPSLYTIGCKQNTPDVNVRQFNAAMRNVDSIVIPNGTFEFNDTIHLSKNCHITGLGINSTIKNVGSGVILSVEGKISHPQFNNFRIDLNDGIGSGIYLENPYDDCFIKNIFVDNCRSYAVKVGYADSDISQTLQMDNILIYTSAVGETVSDLVILNHLQEFTFTNSKFLVRNKNLNKHSNLVINESNNSFIAGNSFGGCSVKPCVLIGNSLAYNQRFIGNWFENSDTAPIDMQLPDLATSSQSYFIGDCFYYNANSDAIFKNAGTVTIIGGMRLNSDIGNSRIILNNTSEQYSKTGLWKSVTNGNEKMISNILFSALYNSKGFQIMHNASETADYGLQISYNDKQLFAIETDGSLSKIYLHSPNGTNWALKVSDTGELSAERA